MISAYGKTKSGFLGYSKLKDDGDSTKASSLVSTTKFERLRSQKSLAVLYGRVRNGRSEESISSTIPVENSQSTISELPSNISSTKDKHSRDGKSPSDSAGSVNEKATRTGQAVRRISRPALTDQSTNRALRRSAGYGDLKCPDDEGVKPQHLVKLQKTQTLLGGFSGSRSRPSTPVSPSIRDEDLAMSPKTRHNIDIWEMSAVRSFPKRWASQISHQGNNSSIKINDDQAEQRPQVKRMFWKLKSILGHKHDGQIEISPGRSHNEEVEQSPDTNQMPSRPSGPSEKISYPDDSFETNGHSAVDGEEHKMNLSKHNQISPRNMPIYESMKSATYSGTFQEAPSSPSYRSSHTKQANHFQDKQAVPNSNKIQGQETSTPTVSRHVKWPSEMHHHRHGSEFLPEIDFHDSGFFDSSFLQTSTPRVRLEPLLNDQEQKHLVCVPQQSGLESINDGRNSLVFDNYSAIEKMELDSTEKPIGLGLEQKPPGPKTNTRQTRYPPKDSLQLRSRAIAKEKTILEPGDINTNKRPKKTALSGSKSIKIRKPAKETLKDPTSAAETELVKNNILGRAQDITPPPRSSSKKVLIKSSAMSKREPGGKSSPARTEQVALDAESSIDPLQLDLTLFRISKAMG